MLVHTLLLSFALSIIEGLPLLVCFMDKSFPPPLGKEEELECLQILADSKKDSARAPIDTMQEPSDPLRVEKAKNKLFDHNTRLVAFFASKYANSGVEKDDLMQLGGIGLIKAILTFKLDKGFKFSTYAARCIENEILMELRKNKHWQSNVSIFEPVSTDSAGNTLDYIDTLGTDSDTVFDLVETTMEIALLRKNVQSLPEREKIVIQSRYGLGGAERKCQREIAKRLKVSRSYVSRLEQKALKILGKEIDL